MTEDPVEKTEISNAHGSVPEQPKPLTPETETTGRTSEEELRTTRRLAKLEDELVEINEEPPIKPKTSQLDSGAVYDQRYSTIAESRYGKGALANHGQALIDMANDDIRENAVILEIGANTGQFLQQVSLSNKMAAKNPTIIGTNINKDAIDEARSNGHDVRFGDAQELPFEDSSVSSVFSLHTLEHVPNLAQAFKEIGRVLEPGGKAFVIVPPNLYGLETLRVAMEDLPEHQKTKGILAPIRNFIEGWKYARKLHCSPLGGPLGGARKHAEQILKENEINMKVSGGIKPGLAMANLLVFEKPETS